MIKKLLLSLCLAATSHGLSALEVNEALPAISVSDKGELLISGDDASYRDWDTTAFSQDKANLIIHIAGRTSSNELIKPFTDRLSTEKFGSDKLRNTTIINLDDAVWGTSGMVADKIKDKKIKHPESIFVLDADGDIRDEWDLESESAAIIVLSNTGEVAYLKQGEMTQDDIDQAISAIKQQLR